MFSRRWFQFSLRGFLVGVTLLAIFLGWMTQHARRQRDAVRSVEGMGGIVQYDWQGDVGTWEAIPEAFLRSGWAPPSRHVPDVEPPAPQWLRNTAVEHLFQRVESVIFRSRQAVYAKSSRPGLTEISSNKPDADLSQDLKAIVPQLRNLPHLKTIYLQGNDKRISEEAEDLLRSELPTCRIVREPVITATRFVPASGKDSGSR